MLIGTVKHETPLLIEMIITWLGREAQIVSENNTLLKLTLVRLETKKRLRQTYILKLFEMSLTVEVTLDA